MNKKIKSYIVMAMGLTLVVGCASSKSTKNSLDISNEMGISSVDSKFPNLIGEGVPEYIGGDNVIPEQAKLISRYSFSIETLDFQKSSSGMSELVEKHKGYLSFSNIQNGTSVDGRIQRTASYEFNMPKDEVLAFNEDLMKVGNLLSENSNSEDVSKQYSDIESRIAAMESQEKRLNELYGKAEKIEDIITIESRLSNLIAEKEIMKAQLLNYDNKVAYTTVGLQLIEVAKFSTEETVQATPTERFKNALKESLYSFKEIMVGIAIGMIFTVPYVLVVGVAGIGIFAILDRIDRKKKKKENKDTDNNVK